jgi:hypothetical protein
MGQELAGVQIPKVTQKKPIQQTLPGDWRGVGRAIRSIAVSALSDKCGAAIKGLAFHDIIQSY